MLQSDPTPESAANPFAFVTPDPRDGAIAFFAHHEAPAFVATIVTSVRSYLTLTALTA